MWWLSQTAAAVRAEAAGVVETTETARQQRGAAASYHSPSTDASTVRQQLCRRWLNSWHGGKGASLRPVSLGRSSVHPGACGNHGT